MSWPALFVADVAWGGADEAADVVAFHEFAHVEFDERFFAAEEEFGEDLGELGFTDAGGSEEDEAADGSFRVFEGRRGRGGRPC